MALARVISMNDYQYTQPIRHVMRFVMLAALGLTVLVSTLSPRPAVANDRPPIEIVGLFKNRAVVRADGGEKLMRVGETTRAGVTLVSANAKEAVVRYRDRRYTLNLSNRVASSFEKVEQRQISVPADKRGQYHVGGTINGNYISFLVDTGASVIAISSQQADRLGLDYRSGKKGVVETAQGRVSSFFFTIDEVDIGGLVAHNVEAAVISGSYPTEILLGMSYLREVAVAEENGVLSLTKRY